MNANWSQHRQIWIRPSSSKLWAAPDGCPASATFEPAEKGTRETEHTLRGTRLHEAVASIINPERPKPLLEDGEWGIARQAVAELERHVAVDAYDWRVERQLERQTGISDAFCRYPLDGTPDLLGILKEGGWRGKRPPKGEPRLVIVDWKFGRHVVRAEGNQQLLTYAVMALFGDDSSIRGGAPWMSEDEIRGMIVQPAMTDYFEGIVSKTTMTYGQVVNEMIRLDELVVDLQDPAKDLAFNPTPTNCRWCEGNLSLKCPMIEKIVSETPSAGCHPDNFHKLLRKAEQVQVFADSIREVAKKSMALGEPVPGLKLIQSRAGNRRWTSEEDAAAYLHENCEGHDWYQPVKLKSPAVIEKLLKKQKEAESWQVVSERYVERGEPTISVAFEDDERESVDGSPDRAAETFKNQRKGGSDGQEV